jgi:hypothetical protein
LQRLSRGLCLDVTCRLPRAFGYPLDCFVFVFPLQSARYREQSQGNSAADSFIDRVAPQRHGHRSSLVSASIVIFVVNPDGDGDQVRFAIRREFKQTQGSRFFAGFRPPALRRHGWRKRGLQKNANGKNPGDDAPPRHAV